MIGDKTYKILQEKWRRIQSAENNIILEKKGDPSFCYMLYIDVKDEEKFIQMQKELQLDGELIESGKFHATVRYVKRNDYQPLVEHLKEIELPQIEGKCVGFEIYGKDKDTLVVELEGKELHDWFKKIDSWLTERGYPKSDFPTYKPHISLTEKAGIEKPKWKKEYEFKVKFSLHVIGDSNHEEVYREKSE
jgi:2'-5' RNA ligase